MSTRPLGATRLLPLRRWRLSRRSLLTASARAGVGAAGLALVGCSDDEDQAQALAQQDEPPEPPQAQAAQAESQQAQQAQQVQQSEDSQPDGQSAQAEAASGPQRGGVIRLWLATERHDRWDPHRSRFRYTRAMHSLMYNRLIRPASVASGELEADLASLPEMPDETTYVFRIEPAAVFWDLEPTGGRAVTAEDARWNIQRQRDALDAGGLPDPHFFRRSVYDRTASAEATSDETLTLTTPRPDATYLASVHGSPFAWITSPEAAELHGDAWRDDPSDVFLNSGTGPYTPLLYNGFELTLARSGNWWRDDSAYADGVTFTSGDPNNIVSLYDAAALDAAGFPLTNETVESLREQYPEHPGYERPLDAGVELLAPLNADPESPLSDPRVLRAAAIAIDRPALVERLYAGHGRPSGPAPWFLDGWSLSDSLLSGFPAYRGDREADLVEIGQLVSAAGGASAVGALTLVVADLFEGFFAGSGEAVRAMIAEATGLEVRARAASVRRGDRPVARRRAFPLPGLGRGAAAGRSDRSVGREFALGRRPALERRRRHRDRRADRADADDLQPRGAAGPRAPVAGASAGRRRAPVAGQAGQRNPVGHPSALVPARPEAVRVRLVDRAGGHVVARHGPCVLPERPGVAGA